MRLLYLIIILTLFQACSKEEISPATTNNQPVTTNPVVKNDSVFKYIATKFDLTSTYPKMQDVLFNNAWVQIGSLSGGLDHCHYKVFYYKGVEHLILNPTSVNKVPLIHLINKSGIWEVEKTYDGPLSNFSSPVSSDMGSDGNYFLSEYGSEAFGTNNLPGGPSVKIQVEDNLTLKFTKASGQEDHTFYSSAKGDLNGDGLEDNVASMMGGQNGKFPGVAGLMVYTQNKDGSFFEDRNFISDPNTDGTYPNIEGVTSIGVANVMGDSRPEIIVSGPFLGIAIYAFNAQIQKFQYVKTKFDAGFFVLDKSKNRSPIETRIVDFNNDGFLDLALEFEGDPGGGIQIWWNDGKGNFAAGPQYFFSNTAVGERYFDVVDINGDGWQDIFIGGWMGSSYNLKNSFWLNNKNKSFAFYDKDLVINPAEKSNITHQIRGFMSNGKFKIIGVTGQYDFLLDAGRYQFKVIDISNFKL
ncbi:FG-GAP repeat domain-containing protein [Aquirufa sp. ROCK-SH2]